MNAIMPCYLRSFPGTLMTMAEPAHPPKRKTKTAPGRRGKRGEASARFRELEAAYAVACRKRFTRFAGDLAAATGDPLAETDHAQAAEVHGLAAAPRPSARLRQIREETYGGATQRAIELMPQIIARGKARPSVREAAEAADRLAQMPEDIQAAATAPLAARGIPGAETVFMAAAEAIGFLASRGCFIGSRGPLPFRDAVDHVRKEYARQAPSDPHAGWTGTWLFVRPAKPGAVIRMPENLREALPDAGAWVRDSLFWRRRIAHGDAVIGKTGELSPTNRGEYGLDSLSPSETSRNGEGDTHD